MHWLFAALCVHLVRACPHLMSMFVFRCVSFLSALCMLRVLSFCMFFVFCVFERV